MSKHLMELLENYHPIRHFSVLTIGYFDGMHRGHLALLKQAQEIAGNEGELIVMTFSNHPLEVLKPHQQVLHLCTLEHKLHLLQEINATIILLPFTHHLAQHTAESFIENTRQKIPFSHLVLGHDAALGRNRQGDRQTMQKLGIEWGFDLHYIEVYRYEGKVVSSTLIRAALQKGMLNEVEDFLGRPYSIYTSILKEKDQKQEQFNFLNIDVTGLCLPPVGIYGVEVLHEGTRIPAVAHLERSNQKNELDSPPLLRLQFEENHPFKEKEDQLFEIIFKIRKEVSE